MFWEFPDSLCIRLSGTELQLEMTANSTYWKAKLRFYGLEYVERGKTPVMSMAKIQSGVGNNVGNTVGSSIYPFFHCITRGITEPSDGS